jgi:SHS2 domain-containing protein
MSNGVKKYKILEHLADLKIRAFGKTKEELFLNMMAGMFESARYESEGKEIKRKIKISSLDFPSLLVDFLSQVLYFCETKKEVYHGLEFKKLTEKELEGTLIGKKLKRMGVHIKGVTYHDLDIHQRKDGSWEATVLFDI